MAVFGIPVALIGFGAALLALMIAGAAALFAWVHTPLVFIMLVQGLVYAPAAFWVWRWRADWRCSPRAILLFVLGLAAVFRVLIVFAPPHSTDIYRYVWDGRVQAHGINPYRYIPADPALERLRDEAIYPGINRADYAPTIYPPTAQLAFWAATRLGETVTVMKLAMLAFEAAAIWAILKLLAARGLPGPLVLIYAWHPLAIWEVAGSGHVDIIAVAFAMLAMLAAERKLLWSAGAALALAACAKFFPLVLAPALWRRWDWKMPLATAITGALLYLPYLSAGRHVFGFLGGYADEGGLTTGDGFLLAVLFREAGLGDAALPAFLLCALGLLAALALRTLFRAAPERPDITGASAIAAAFTVLISPHHAWYFLWLTPFLCFALSPSVLYLTLAAPALYRVGWPPSLLGAALLYVPFLVLLVIETARPFTFKEIAHERARA
jgi:alpha-1,6-mannosyltransferase